LRSPRPAGASANCWRAIALRWPGGHRRGFDVSSKLSDLGYKEVGCDSNNPMVPLSYAPSAIAGSGCTAIHVERKEAIGTNVVPSQWNAFINQDGSQFYISAPPTICSSSKQSLVSMLEIAESLGCSTAWMYVDRQRSDFVTVVSAFKYLGFQLSQKVFKDTEANKIYALLRYELE
jgi:hypothetical protein